MSRNNPSLRPGSAGRESRLVQVVRHELEGVSPLPAHILVGYSGGVDSLALLLLLSSLMRSADFRVTAVHVDHGVRASSSSDADVATRVCDDLGIPFILKRVSPALLGSHEGVGPEEALRRERYRAFSEAMVESSAGLVALAHHQRDQAETVLLHLLRGAGLRGASGMRPVSHVRVPWWEDSVPVAALTIWRPLLGVAPGMLDELVGSSGMPVAVDDSNRDESYRRNAIRHTVLPVLEHAAPGATANLARFASLCAIDDDELDAQAARALDEIRQGDGLDRPALLELPEAIRDRVVRRWILELAPVGLEVSRERIEALIAVASTPGGIRRVDIGRGASVIVTREHLQFVVHPLT